MLPVLAPLALLASPAFAWSEHRLITREALKGVPSLQLVVKAETLADYLKGMNFSGTEADFVKKLKLDDSTKYPFRIGETAGSTVTLAEVLAGYADEPDWGMDENIFEQYPEEWKDDFQYMGGKLAGLGSRFVRHMYWPAGFLKAPPAGSSEPVRDSNPLGESPERCQLFFDLARASFAAGHRYWGARFLSWSFHYVQDVTMPFHADQLPAKAFLYLRPDGKLDVEGSIRRIIYYHLVFEAYTTKMLSGDQGKDIEKRLESSLSGASIQASSGTARELVKSAAQRSQADAYEAGRVALTFFPAVEDPTGLDPLAKLRDPEYWKEVARKQEGNPGPGKRFQDFVEKRFVDAGKVTRSLVLQAAALMWDVPVVFKPLQLLPSGLDARTRALLEREAAGVEKVFSR